MNYLNSYLRSKLDLSSIGFQRGEKESGYFCTPVLSKVLGWAGVDGTHFCTTTGFGEMIFAVSPANAPGEYVHPVANNFEDFLRLILACHDTVAIEQCWFMDREVFENFLENNPPTDEMTSCLQALQKKYKLSPMEDPFQYIQDIQNGFDYGLLRFPPEYYEIVEDPEQPVAPEWKVTWDGDFFDTDPDSIGAEPISVQTHFQWAGIEWFVPEIYSFDQGIIIYLLGKVDPDQVPQNEFHEYLSPEAHERMMAENPLNLHVRPNVMINDIALRPSGGTGITWMTQEGWNLESRWVLEHYGLDMSYAWQINRIRFFWPVCGKMNINKMSIIMIQDKISVSGTHFKTPDAGNCVVLTHPQTEKEYILYIDELKQEVADFRRLHDQEMEFPTCYTQMHFRITPDMSRNDFRIVDCAQSDQPRYKKDYKKPENEFAVSFGIIGGASGPVTLVTRHESTSNETNHIATSALHFDPVEEIEWRTVFQEKPNEDMTVSLI